MKVPKGIVPSELRPILIAHVLAHARRVCACMQAQHKVQLDERDGRGAPPPPNPLQAPGVQMMGPSAYAGPPPGGPQGGPPQVRLSGPLVPSCHLAPQLNQPKMGP